MALRKHCKTTLRELVDERGFVYDGIESMRSRGLHELLRSNGHKQILLVRPANVTDLPSTNAGYFDPDAFCVFHREEIAESV